MTGAQDVLQGKRVVIHPAGREPFGLPDTHSAEIVKIGSQDNCVHLKSPNGDGIYKILQLESRGEEVVIRTGESLIQGGPARWASEGARQPVGYPFPPLSG